MNHNPKDPLIKATPPAGRELFSRVSQVANGFPGDAVMDAAGNLIINVLRQAHPTRAQAERAFDAYMARLKGVLLDQHYDSMGRKKGIFPYDQVINVPHLDMRRKEN